MLPLIKFNFRLLLNSVPTPLSSHPRNSIPSNGKIAKDAKECVQECVSEFVSFVTSEAADRCQQEKRKTINGEDLLFAMSTLGFDSYVEPLKIFLSKYRDSLKTEKTGLGVVGEIDEGMVRELSARACV